MTGATVRYTSSLDGIHAEDLTGGFWVGWPAPPTPAMHLAMLRGSEVVVLAIDDASGQVVGFVNAVGDGVLAAYVPCLEVLPAWHGQGIGSELVRRILAALEPRYMVDLVCDDDVVPFYERLGMMRYTAMIRRDRRAIMTSLGRFPDHPASDQREKGAARMTHDDVQRWLDAYVDAWRTYDPDAIGALFAEDATYRYHPYDEEAVVGRAAIVADWLEEQDAPGSWEAHYEPFAVDGDRAVTIGQSRYVEADGKLRDLYDNIWTLRFDADGRCTEFVEWFMERPKT